MKTTISIYRVGKGIIYQKSQSYCLESSLLGKKSAYASMVTEMHIWNAIDWINDDTTKLSVDTKAQLLCELVGELKDMLPESYDAAWNRPDLKLRACWHVIIQKEIKSLAEIRNVWRKIKKLDDTKSLV